MKTIIALPTWRCPECNYVQDFDPNDASLMAIHFPGHTIGNCPACESGKTISRKKQQMKMKKETDPQKKTKVTIADPDLVDEYKVKAKDKNGNFKRDADRNIILRSLTDKEKADRRTKISSEIASWKELADPLKSDDGL